jgi:ribulose-phosphate 3-epimerase
MSENKKVEIIPAVLPQSFAEMEESLRPLSEIVRQVQIDVVDGHYAKGKTWPYRDRKSFDKIVAEEHGLPFWDKLDFQFDLMVEEPMLELKNFIQAGATQIIFHVHSKNVEAALQSLVDMRTDEMGSYAVRVGVAMGPQEQPDVLEPFEAQFDFVQVMGIDREGRQGEPFNKRAVYLVERLHKRYPYLPIQVDGGVSIENARELAAAGASRLIVGHAIIKADDPVAAYNAFVEEANKK